MSTLSLENIFRNIFTGFWLNVHSKEFQVYATFEFTKLAIPLKVYIIHDQSTSHKIDAFLNFML